LARYIVSADNHLRYDPPVCRLDEDWLAFQRKALCDIVDLANTYEADLVIAGDLFDAYLVHTQIISLFIEAVSPLIGVCHIIGGNHALKYHREALAFESSIGVIKAIAGDNTGKIRYYPCTEENIGGRFEHSYVLNEDVTLVHTLVFPDDDAIPFACKGVTADYLFDKYDTQWIFTGDMHHNFVATRDERHVINPGCMTIQVADELDYTPGVYYIDTGNKIDVRTLKDKKPVYRTTKSEIKFIPIHNDPTMLTRNHLDKNKERDDRLSAFVVTIVTGKELHLSFKANLDTAYASVKATPMMDTIKLELEQRR
jgi:hypothetical protein